MPRKMDPLQRRADAAEKELVTASPSAEFQQGLAALMEREVWVRPPSDPSSSAGSEGAAEGDEQMECATPRAPPTPRRRPAPTGTPATPEPSAKWLAASAATPMTPDRGGKAVKALPNSPAPFFCMTPKNRGRRQEALSLHATPDNHLRKVKDTPPPAPLGVARRKQEELHHAVRAGDTALLKMALQKGHHCGCVNTHFAHEAVRHQHLPALRLLLQEGHACDDHCNGRRPLHLAVQTCMVEGDQGYQMAKLLLEHGARPCPTPGDDLRKCSPLTDAAQRCCTSAVALLLAHGADPNQADLRGDTPLHIACRYAHPARGPPLPHAEAVGRTVQERVVDLLIQKGANPTQKDHAGQPPIAHVPKQSGCLREKLHRAERWWSLRGFQVVCAHFAQDHQLVETSTSFAGFAKADIVQVIGSYI